MHPEYLTGEKPIFFHLLFQNICCATPFFPVASIFTLGMTLLCLKLNGCDVQRELSLRWFSNALQVSIYVTNKYSRLLLNSYFRVFITDAISVLA